MQEISPEMVRQWRDDIDRALAWLQTHATICPVVAGEDLPRRLREHLGNSDIFDSLVAARESQLLLVTDDLPIRQFSHLLGGGIGACLQQVFLTALDRKSINLDMFIRWSANLIDAGHNYVGVSGASLARALQMDTEAGGAPGCLFTTLAKAIGGRKADPRSHLAACLGCLLGLWSDPETVLYRERATGLLLRQLVRERHDDYGIILQAVFRWVQSSPQLTKYVYSWMRGHFLLSVLNQSPDGTAANASGAHR
jgi:cellulose synthase operon protein C